MYNSFLKFRYSIKHLFSNSEYNILEKSLIPIVVNALDVYWRENTKNPLFEKQKLKIVNDKNKYQYHLSGIFSSNEESFNLHFTKYFWFPFFINYQKKLVKKEIFSAFLFNYNIIASKNDQILFLNDHIMYQQEENSLNFITVLSDFIIHKCKKQ